MSASALIASTPTDADIDAAMAGDICLHPVRQAIKRAAEPESVALGGSP
jgi:hypothetical protein